LCVLRRPFVYFVVTSGLSGLRGAAFFPPGPVEPWQERLDVALFDRRAGPDADARRRGTMAGQIIAGAFGFEPRRHRADRLEASVGREPLKPRVGDRQLDRGARPGGRILGEKARP